MKYTIVSEGRFYDGLDQIEWVDGNLVGYRLPPKEKWVVTTNGEFERIEPKYPSEPLKVTIPECRVVAVEERP